MEIAYNPGITSAGADRHNDWTGGGGLINSLGPMLGGLVSDPAQPGSGKPGSPGASPDTLGNTGAPAGLKGAFWGLVIVVGLFVLASKI